MTFAMRGQLLPDGEWRTIYLDGDRLTFDAVANAELLCDGGWILPGLVDVHTHPGAAEPGDDLDDDLLRAHLAAHAHRGVSVVHTPGIAGGEVP